MCNLYDKWVHLSRSELYGELILRVRAITISAHFKSVSFHFTTYIYIAYIYIRTRTKWSIVRGSREARK